MTTKLWPTLSVLGVLSLATSASAGSDGFIQPDTRIRGCIAIVDKVRDGSTSPTEWLDQNKEEFLDLQLELKARNYPPQKTKEMMMGMAITICMDRKSFINTCVNARDQEKRDLQIMRTAHIAECWARRVAEEPRPPPDPTKPTGPVGPVLPNMSAADLAQFNEDASIIAQPKVILGRDEAGAIEARFADCADYWQSLHYNRPPAVRQILYSVRVARCMHRTRFAVWPACPPSFDSMLQPRCYARF